mgnify:FL=1|tara:strand:+ start:371 stop:625 length:255 start_codon:yes stop_codon:yes gene_type:complete
MNNTVYVLKEYDLDFKEWDLIGVCSTLEDCANMIYEYFGEYQVLQEWDIRDSGLEYKKKLLVNVLCKLPEETMIHCEYYTLNTI